MIVAIGDASPLSFYDGLVALVGDSVIDGLDHLTADILPLQMDFARVTLFQHIEPQ